MEWAFKKAAVMVGPSAPAADDEVTVSSLQQEDSAAPSDKPTLVRVSTEDSLTPSIRDLFDHGPGLVEENGYKATFLLHAKRLLATNVGKCKLLKREEKSLIQDMRLGNRAAQYCAWRNTLLHAGVLFYAFNTVMEILVVVDIWQTKGQGSFFMQRMDPRYHAFFDGLHVCNWVQSVGFLLASIAAVIFAGIAAIRWKRHLWSRRWVFASWICSYLPPFLLLLVIPYRSAVDFKGVQVQMCRDMLNLTSTVQERTQWPGKVGELAKTLWDAYSLQLPGDFCDGEPTQWGSRIRGYLDANGFLGRVNGTCGYADSAMQSLSLRTQADLAAGRGNISFGPLTVAVGTSLSDCPSACTNCTSVCAPHLMRLLSLAAVHGDDVLSAVSLGSVASQCGHCVSRDPELRCMFKCPDAALALDRQAILGLIPTPGRLCFEEKQVTDFEILMQLGTQTAYWRMLVGTVYAALSLCTLLPLAFSLMLGAAKGASIAKSLIPYSRVPTVISTSAAVFTFPFVFMITILVQNVAGTWLTLVGIILILIAFLASMKPGTLKAESTAEMQKRQQILGKIGAAAGVVALVIFVVVFAISDLAAAIYDVLKEQELTLTQEDLKSLGSQTTWAIVNTVSTVFGKSLISTVFFGDAVVSLMYRFHKGEDEDPFSIQCARTKLVEDLNSLFQDGVPCQAVAPADEPRPAVSAQDIADQHKAMMFARIKNVAQAGKFTGKMADRVQEIEKIQARVEVRRAARQLGDETAEVATAARERLSGAREGRPSGAGEGPQG